MKIRILALLLALSAPATAQYLYALNIHGKLTINGTVLDSLPTEFDPDTGQFDTQLWAAFDVEGPDRHALRYDGRLQSNGKKAGDFPMAIDTGTGTLYGWSLIDATPNGVHMLRQEGLLMKGETAVVTYPYGGFFFTGLVVDTELVTDTVYALRSDGAVYSGTGTSPVARFKAALPEEPADGTEILTGWADLALDVTGGKLYALRRDGRLWSVSLADIAAFIGSGTGNPPGGTEVGKLPAPADEQDVIDFYVDLAFSGTTWRALQADGAVYTSASVLEPLVDYAGSGIGSEDFAAVLAVGADTWAVRDDGLVFKNTAANDAVLNLVGEDYVALGVGLEPPDLTSFKNPQPKASPYTVTLREGQPASVPVVVNDVEKLPADLVVTEDEKLPLPAGVTFQEVDDGNGGLIRTLEWDGSGLAGKYKSRLLVSDGVTKPVKFMTSIVVKPADLVPEKNKPPVPCKVKQVLGLIGYEVRLPLLADDLDGDPLSITVDEEKYPFTAGATFDVKTGVFTWTPTNADIGVKSFKFFVSDGVKTKVRTVKIKVISPLIFEDGI